MAHGGGPPWGGAGTVGAHTMIHGGRECQAQVGSCSLFRGVWGGVGGLAASSASGGHAPCFACCARTVHALAPVLHPWRWSSLSLGVRAPGRASGCHTQKHSRTHTCIACVWHKMPRVRNVRCHLTAADSERGLHLRLRPLAWLWWAGPRFGGGGVQIGLCLSPYVLRRRQGWAGRVHRSITAASEGRS